MSQPAAPSDQGTSTRPYLIRALHDWCTDNGFTPYIAVFVDARVQVPMEYVKNNEIVLNVGFEATSGLSLGNDSIEFTARFGGSARQIIVPVDHVVAIDARENGQGMAFPVPAGAAPAPRPEALSPVEPALAGALGGLRLARSEPPEDRAAEPPTPRAGWTDDEPPESPTPAPSGRPSLKRIK